MSDKIRVGIEAMAESGERVGAVTRVARQLGIGPESLRNWVKPAEIDSGKRPDQLRSGTVSNDASPSTSPVEYAPAPA